MESHLRLIALAAGAWAVFALAFLWARAKSFGRTEWFAPAAGRPAAGVFYAFGAGMSPWAKESVREHLPSYFLGVFYHLGIFAALALLLLQLANIAPADPILALARIATAAGALAGTGLLGKRLLTPELRGLSCPDDYLSNLLATAFSALAFSAALAPALVPVFWAEAALLFFYIPLGKIKHCCFFFSTRFALGAHLGRRGVFPPRS